ncbi:MULTISPECIES: LCP family protein [unclassified Micromonospora]|uniref:LCP family protein n=1 Tax=unclassified Micromonospora TaxID=2617518 RepID=UPI0022B5E621|nr:MULTISPECIES: LCP family protein [unclassified Micromonospora]MCZ7418627.1 LCP family protein [Verrucosispora sp. WMMA2121]WBB92333.1 LCP family protein [Verrucosispora sp. WMMC514]
MAKVHFATSVWRRMSGWQKAGVSLVALLGVLCAAGVTLGIGLKHRYESRVQREDILGHGTAPRDDERWNSGPLNLLLLGSDSRAGEADEGLYPGQRSDTIMLVHLNATRDTATVVSIPRDSYVEVPARSGSWPGGLNKINAAFAFGGASLAAETVHKLTGATIDGVLVANFAAVRQIVDAIGGVTVCLPYVVISTDTGTRWQVGCHQLDGRNTDDLMRQRHNVPGGDFGRIQTQQLVVRAIVEKITAENLLTDPARLDRVLTTTAESLTVDRELDIAELVLAVRRITTASLRFVTVPAAETDLMTPAGSSVQLDERLSMSLFAALREDRLDEWFASQPATSIPD